MLLKNPIIIVENNKIIELIENKGGVKEIAAMEFYSGIITPGFIDFIDTSLFDSAQLNKYMIKAESSGVRYSYDYKLGDLYLTKRNNIVKNTKLNINQDSFIAEDFKQKIIDLSQTTKRSILDILPQFFLYKYNNKNGIFENIVKDDSLSLNLISGINYSNWNIGSNLIIKKLI